MKREWHPLYTEREAMLYMGPVQRRAHVAFSKFHWWLCGILWGDFTRAPSRTLRVWFWVWRQYRRTWRKWPQ